MKFTIVANRACVAVSELWLIIFAATNLAAIYYASNGRSKSSKVAAVRGPEFNDLWGQAFLFEFAVSSPLIIFEMVE